MKAIAKNKGIASCTDDYSIIDSREYQVFFDAGTTQIRPDLLNRAMKSGKHVYCEKPIGMSLAEAKEVCDVAKETRVNTDIVMDKLVLPGLIKLKKLVDEGFFGRILNIKIDFGFLPVKIFQNKRHKGQAGIIEKQMAEA